MKGLWLLALVLLLGGCAAPGTLAVRFIGEQRLPPGLSVGGTPVGGLSAIDYDPASRGWVLLSDDRSERAPARAYTARLGFDDERFSSVTLDDVITLRRADGTAYPAPAAGAYVDTEALRIDPADGSWWYASEGLPMFVRHADRAGRLLGELPLPARLTGARVNLGLEGMSFAPDGQALWLALEAPLRQDGAPASVAAGGLVRLTRIDRAGRQLAQYAYPLDAIPVAPASGKLADNGVSEILAIDAARLLVLERSGSQDAGGRFRFHVRLYEASASGATDVGQVDALAGATARPMHKRLLADLGTLPLSRVDNLEGMAWGPRLPDGSASLVMVSDDNFNATQVTQLLLFAVSGVP